MAVSQALVEALIRYRRHLGLTEELPAPNDTLPLFERAKPHVPLKGLNSPAHIGVRGKFFVGSRAGWLTPGL